MKYETKRRKFWFCVVQATQFILLLSQPPFSASLTRLACISARLTCIDYLHPMSLNDVYTHKYTPTPKTEALEYIDSVLHEAEEEIRSELTKNYPTYVQVWKEIHAKLARGEYSENQANKILSRKQLPLLEDDYKPTEDNLVRWRVQSVKLYLDYNLLSAIRDACGKN